MNKKLYRSTTNRKLEGVCGGLAEYMGWDPDTTRLAFAILCLFWGTGIIVYILAAMILPEDTSIV